MSVITSRSLNLFKCFMKRYFLESDLVTGWNIKLMNVLNIQKRNLNLLEHVSYQLLNEYGIKTPRYGVAKSAEEAKKIFKDLNVEDCVIKAQVLTGGRQRGHFKSGFKKGVHTATSAEEVAEIAGKMIGDHIITKQTGAEGLPCSKVMITERKFPRKEFYFSVIMDRKFDGPAVIASSQGGTSIEDVAAENPEAIIMVPVDIAKGLSKDKAMDVCKKVGMVGKAAESTAKVLQNLFKMFMEKDATLLEMNPYIEDTTGNYICLDAKCRFDDSAAYRQRDLFALRDLTQEKEVEIEASKRDLNYIQLDGQIGCVVNGAGLAMATMDIIKLHGGEPANFLDVGGQATLETIQFALGIILNDKKVEVILVNIFGGIMRCDLIATGLVTAVQNMKLKTPIVVRLLGTNVTEAKEIISKSKLKLITIDKFDEAAKVSSTVSTILGLARKANINISVH